MRMHARLQRIEHAHPVSAGEQQIDGVRADESGAPGDQDHPFHTRSTRRRV